MERTDQFHDVIEFAKLVGKLKTVSRRGWFLRGVVIPESVADHSFRVSLLTLILAPRHEPPLDVSKAVCMALVHDVAEASVGDITPYDGVGVVEKAARERQAFEAMSDMISDDNLLRLWEEYEAGNTPESQLVKEIDVLETVVQAFEYQSQLPETEPSSFDDFWSWADERVRTALGRGLLSTLRRARDESQFPVSKEPVSSSSCIHQPLGGR